MEWGKAKCILITVLAALNLFLLGTYYVRMRTQGSVHDAAKAVSEYYATIGIELDADVVPGNDADRSIMIIERSSELEAQAAKALLRYGAIITGVGGSVTYKADMGSVTWQSGGALDAEFAAPGGTDDDSAALLQELLSGAGINPTWFSGNESGLVMTRECLGCPVYDNMLTAVLDENGWWKLTGRWYLGEPARASSETEHEAAGLLVTFAEELRNAGVEIKTVTAMEKGWISGLVSNVGVKLTPVYRITTDIGDFYINAINGAILTAE